MGYSKQGGWGYTFLKRTPGIFHFFTLPLEIPDKTKVNPGIFLKIVQDSLEIPRAKTKNPGNSTLFCLGHTLKFLFVFNEPLEIPHAISLIPLEIAYLQPHLVDFFCNSPVSYREFERGQLEKYSLEEKDELGKTVLIYL